MARVALDAMGGDFAPRATVAGALLALAELPPEHSLQLVGQTTNPTVVARMPRRANSAWRKRSRSPRSIGVNADAGRW